MLDESYNSKGVRVVTAKMHSWGTTNINVNPMYILRTQFAVHVNCMLEFRHYGKYEEQSFFQETNKK